ncbi:BlaI/MecI/CopY family transcriptional regulator [Phenylobacterium deserti]|uniref:BlaI/MecI/CopY family transcriptional regulator n=1 Tax=Phenylobacterium deserti TaxID=1914756 RepID=A0A328AUB8_9CAUL|nr:BlaI/MecI/CopY family transcriptional regulator [Phenylobacterium deserti]RAK56538.1 BlaI/MecI/CopY family transcriptional regulator [Phenylobacterium deserti]
MTDTPRISAGESQVMEALWSSGPLSADEIVRQVAPAQGWGEATVKTLINRLLKKKALVSERSEGRTLYRPLISREAYLTEESQGLLDRLFGGRLAPMVAHFARQQQLSPEEMAQLKRLIREMDTED